MGNKKEIFKGLDFAFLGSLLGYSRPWVSKRLNKLIKTSKEEKKAILKAIDKYIEKLNAIKKHIEENF